MIPLSFFYFTLHLIHHVVELGEIYGITVICIIPPSAYIMWIYSFTVTHDFTLFLIFASGVLPLIISKGQRPMGTVPDDSDAFKGCGLLSLIEISSGVKSLGSKYYNTSHRLVDQTRFEFRLTSGLWWWKVRELIPSSDLWINLSSHRGVRRPEWASRSIWKKNIPYWLITNL
jgi:hypothetical protein